MRLSVFVWGMLLIAMFITLPATAFTNDKLDIEVDQAGSGMITINYTLSFFEDIAAWLNIVNPAKEIQKEIERSTGKTAVVLAASTDAAVFKVVDYATTERSGNTIIQTTPRLSFTEAENYLKNQWFSFLIGQDLSPAITTVRFADGSTETFTNVLEIPSIKHSMAI